MTSRPAVFTDRDGTLTEEVGYVNHPDRLKLLPRDDGRRQGERSDPGPGGGAAAVLVLTGYARGEWKYRRRHFEVEPDHVANDLLAAVDWTLAKVAVRAEAPGGEASL